MKSTHDFKNIPLLVIMDDIPSFLEKVATAI